MNLKENGMSITINGVRHVYKGDTVALDGIDLTIGTGLFGMLGPIPGWKNGKRCWETKSGFQSYGGNWI